MLSEFLESSVLLLKNRVLLSEQESVELFLLVADSVVLDDDGTSQVLEKTESEFIQRVR